MPPKNNQVIHNQSKDREGSKKSSKSTITPTPKSKSDANVPKDQDFSFGEASGPLINVITPDNEASTSLAGPGAVGRSRKYVDGVPRETSQSLKLPAIDGYGHSTDRKGKQIVRPKARLPKDVPQKNKSVDSGSHSQDSSIKESAIQGRAIQYESDVSKLEDRYLKSSTLNGPNSKSNADAHKGHGAGYEETASSIIKQTKVASTSKAKSGFGRGTYEHIDVALDKAPGSSRRSVQPSCNEFERSISAQMALLDRFKKLIPLKGKSDKSAPEHQVGRLGSGAKDLSKSKRPAKEVKSIYDLSVLQDRTGKMLAP